MDSIGRHFLKERLISIIVASTVKFFPEGFEQILSDGLPNLFHERAIIPEIMYRIQANAQHFMRQE
jgi:hypothetical protein